MPKKRGVQRKEAENSPIDLKATPEQLEVIGPAASAIWTTSIETPTHSGPTSLVAPMEMLLATLLFTNSALEKVAASEDGNKRGGKRKMTQKRMKEQGGLTSLASELLDVSFIIHLSSTLTLPPAARAFNLQLVAERTSTRVSTAYNTIGNASEFDTTFVDNSQTPPPPASAVSLDPSKSEAELAASTSETHPEEKEPESQPVNHSSSVGGTVESTCAATPSLRENSGRYWKYQTTASYMPTDYSLLYSSRIGTTLGNVYDKKLLTWNKELAEKLEDDSNLVPDSSIYASSSKASKLLQEKALKVFRLGAHGVVDLQTLPLPIPPSFFALSMGHIELIDLHWSGSQEFTEFKMNQVKKSKQDSYFSSKSYQRYLKTDWYTGQGRGSKPFCGDQRIFSALLIGGWKDSIVLYCKSTGLHYGSLLPANPPSTGLPFRVTYPVDGHEEGIEKYIQATCGSELGRRGKEPESQKFFVFANNGDHYNRKSIETMALRKDLFHLIRTGQVDLLALLISNGGSSRIADNNLREEGERSVQTEEQEGGQLCRYLSNGIHGKSVSHQTSLFSSSEKPILDVVGVAPLLGQFLAVTDYSIGSANSRYVVDGNLMDTMQAEQTLVDLYRLAATRPTAAGMALIERAQQLGIFGTSSGTTPLLNLPQKLLELGGLFGFSKLTDNVVIPPARSINVVKHLLKFTFPLILSDLSYVESNLDVKNFLVSSDSDKNAIKWMLFLLKKEDWLFSILNSMGYGHPYRDSMQILRYTMLDIEIGCNVISDTMTPDLVKFLQYLRKQKEEAAESGETSTKSTMHVQSLRFNIPVSGSYEADPFPLHLIDLFLQREYCSTSGSSGGQQDDGGGTLLSAIHGIKDSQGTSLVEAIVQPAKSKNKSKLPASFVTSSHFSDDVDPYREHYTAGGRLDVLLKVAEKMSFFEFLKPATNFGLAMRSVFSRLWGADGNLSNPQESFGLANSLIDVLHTRLESTYGGGGGAEKRQQCTAMMSEFCDELLRRHELVWRPLTTLRMGTKSVSHACTYLYIPSLSLVSKILRLFSGINFFPSPSGLDENSTSQAAEMVHALLPEKRCLLAVIPYKQFLETEEEYRALNEYVQSLIDLQLISHGDVELEAAGAGVGWRCLAKK